jgi:hypothetical protein
MRTDIVSEGKEKDGREKRESWREREGQREREEHMLIDVLGFFFFFYCFFKTLPSRYKCDPEPFLNIEYACIAWFTLELLVRFACTPSRAHFFRDPLNIIDLASVVPFFATVGLSSKEVCVRGRGGE